VNRTILHVDLDAFYVGVEVARRPELKGKPVVVSGDVRSRGVVLSASYEARQFGIDSAMPAARALHLCPTATFVPPDFRAYSKASKAFMDVLREYSPLVEPTSLDEAYIDYTGCEPLHGPVEQAAADIRRRIEKEISVTASVGIGPSRIVAKVASAAAKPDGVIHIRHGEEAAFLAPLPIRKLPGIGPKAQQRLEAIGIRRLGQIAGLSDEFLTQNLGNHGPELRLRALGIDAGSIHEGRPANRSISKSTTFGKDHRDLTKLHSTLLWEAEGVAEEVRRQNRRARTVTLQIKFADFTNVTRSITLAQPTGSGEVLYQAAVGLLARELERDPRAIRLVGVSASNLVDGAQMDLFGEASEHDSLDKALDELRERFGHGVVRRGRVVPEPHAWSADD
jgi:DNA polymerase IV